jgi:hypothetical protein
MMAIFLPSIAAAQASLPLAEVAQVELTMRTWLSHPMEFGIAPKRVHYLRSVPMNVTFEPTPISIHIVEYVMPDGTYGRGFVNPVTWSFLGPIPYEKLTDVELVTAYTGWLYQFTLIQQGNAVLVFDAQTLKPLLTELEAEGVRGVVVTVQTKIGTSELFEFTGTRDRKSVKGAGSAGSKLILDANSPLASLPVVFTYLGLVMQGKI